MLVGKGLSIPVLLCGSMLEVAITRFKPWRVWKGRGAGEHFPTLMLLCMGMRGGRVHLFTHPPSIQCISGMQDLGIPAPISLSARYWQRQDKCPKTQGAGLPGFWEVLGMPGFWRAKVGLRSGSTAIRRGVGGKGFPASAVVWDPVSAGVWGGGVCQGWLGSGLN